jgi:hypothetical protein
MIRIDENFSYPSAWNYMDKIKYDPGVGNPDPPFRTKKTSLFWRGSTSEGVSIGGVWKGMARQRLAHLTNTTYQSTETPLFLSYDSSSGFTLTSVSVSAPNLLDADVGIVDKIARCNGADCSDEELDLGFKSAADFQAHWGYKYLFDLDGGGFSGRFLPFLTSHSLPFKAALFREWYDDRLTPWLHFVPQDLRLQDVYSTLAYFAGLSGTVNGRDVKMLPHEEEAKRIAEDGRVWAGTALRKEDMEIYMFRLLLEWGRLTDDRRNQLGFVL